MGFVLPGMTQSRITGIFWIAAGLGLFAVLAYEPAILVNALGLQNSVSEGAVVLSALGVVLTCGMGGVMALRSKPVPAKSR